MSHLTQKKKKPVHASRPKKKKKCCACLNYWLIKVTLSIFPLNTMIRISNIHENCYFMMPYGCERVLEHLSILDIVIDVQDNYV